MVKKSRPPISFEQMQEIISSIYDAALDESQWGIVLNKVARAINAEQGNLRFINPGSLDIYDVHTFNKDPHWTQAYIDHYIKKDPWVTFTYQLSETYLDCTHYLVSDKAYEAMEFYNDFNIPQNIHYGIGGKINVNKNLTGYLTLQRGRKRQGFEQYYLDALKGFAVHIRKALLINEKTRHIELQEHSLREALDQINTPLLLVNKHGEIVFINDLAEQLIEKHPCISIKNNCISLSSPDDNAQLGKLIHQATPASGKQGGAMCYTVPANQVALSILVNPVNPDKANIDMQSDNVALLVLSSNNQQTSLPTELISALYNFTPAESRLVALLCRGLTLDEISKNLSLSKNTLRTQLRSCFGKTGVTRQADLINLINGGPAGIIKSS
jgi:DNA-binding CsgD family transcriptional regulator/PAS domain-containing protein